MKAREPWPIPELWPGSTVYIIGGGPSLAGMDFTPLFSKRCIGVNQAYKLGPWIDILYFGDCNWYRNALPDIRSFAGLKITSCGSCPKNGWKHVHRVKRSKMKGIESKDRSAIAWNYNSGASAINIAYWLGAKRVILLGFDMQCDGNSKKNWHDDYKGETPNEDLFQKHLSGFPFIAKQAKRLGLEILNATPGSAIKQFPFVKLEDTL